MNPIDWTNKGDERWVHVEGYRKIDASSTDERSEATKERDTIERDGLERSPSKIENRETTIKIDNSDSQRRLREYRSLLSCVLLFFYLLFFLFSFCFKTLFSRIIRYCKNTILIFINRYLSNWKIYIIIVILAILSN